MSNHTASSTSNSQLRNSTRSASNSSAQHPQSIQRSLNSLTLGVKDGGIGQRRFSSASRISTRTNSRQTTPQLARRRPTTTAEDLGVDRNEQVPVNENLNTSTTSTATEDMDISENQTTALINSAPIMNNARQTKGSIKKDQLVEKFFVKLNTGGFYCKLCQGAENEKKVHKEISNSDSNLRSHLARRHKREEFLYPSQRLHYNRKTQTLSSEMKKKLDEALIYAIIHDGRSFGDFRKSGFQEFLKRAFPDVNYKGPDRSTVKKRVLSLYALYRKKLRHQLASVSDISLTTDAWTSSRRVHYVCLTAHFFEKDFGFKSLTLCFRCFIGRSVGIRIRQFIRKELRKLNINSKIRSITSDNGSNMKLALETNEFGFRVSCMAHNLNLTVTNGLGLWSKEKSSDSVESSNDNEEVDDNFTNVNQDEIVDDSNDDESCSSDDEETQSRYEESSTDRDGDDYDDDSDASSAESSESDDDSRQDSQMNDPKLSEQQGSTANVKVITLNLMKRTRRLVAMIHHSSTIEKYFMDQISLKQQEINQRSGDEENNNVQFKQLLIDFCVRWNSTYKMISRVVHSRQIINEITHTPDHINVLNAKQARKLCKLAFNHNDWNWLIAMETVLRPFEKATRILSGRSYQTLGIKRLVMNGLKKFLTTYKSSEPIVNLLKKQLLSEYEGYCEDNLSIEEREAMMICCFLNPTVYYCLRDDVEYLQEAKQLIITRCRDSNSSMSLLLSSSSSIVTSNTEKQPSKSLSAIESFFNNCDLPMPSKSIDSSGLSLHTIEQEIGLYVSSIDHSTEFQTFWNSFGHRLPKLSRLVRRFCIMAATSVASESAFSVAGYLQRKQRASLAPKTLRSCMLLRDLEPSDFFSQ